METAIAARPAQTAISTRSNVQLVNSLKRALAGLAEARQASVSAETLNLYSQELCEFDTADVRTVMRTLASRKRAEGETAIPELGAFLEPLREMRRRSKQRERVERERKEQIDLFWREILPDRMARFGCTEMEVLAQFPSFKGTKPRV